MESIADTHQFALQYTFLKMPRVGQELQIVDHALVTRMAAVLRLKVGDVCILFDKVQHCKISCVEFSKKSILCKILAVTKNSVTQPNVTFLLPLLKKDALADAVYSCVEIGISEIRLVVTEKVSRKWGGQKELDRLQKIVIAAAEQSKNYSYPDVIPPVALQEVVTYVSNQAVCLFADPDGLDLVGQVGQCQNKDIVLSVGPEADLSEKEKDILKGAGFIFVRLTSTILRAVQAVAVLAGMVRTITRKK